MMVMLPSTGKDSATTSPSMSRTHWTNLQKHETHYGGITTRSAILDAASVRQPAFSIGETNDILPHRFRDNIRRPQESKPAEMQPANPYVSRKGVAFVIPQNPRAESETSRWSSECGSSSNCTTMVRSPSIPIRKKSTDHQEPSTNTVTWKRTPSELQLREDLELADWRDYLMFSRIVSSIKNQQQMVQNQHLRRENDQCLAHIIGTRCGASNGNPQELQSSQYPYFCHHSANSEGTSSWAVYPTDCSQPEGIPLHSCEFNHAFGLRPSPPPPPPPFNEPYVEREEGVFDLDL